MYESSFIGNTSSVLPTTNASNLPFDISLSKTVIASSAVTTTTTARKLLHRSCSFVNYNVIFSLKAVLFSTMHRSATSVDLQSFRTMLNTQPFNNESAFLARHNRVNRINLISKETVSLNVRIRYHIN